MSKVRKTIRRAARRYGVDPGILEAQLRAESGLRRNAVSPAGARGIAQFMPATAKQYGVNLNDGKIKDDIDGAARYMRDNLRKTGGNYHEALSIYNSGRPDAYKDPTFAKGQTYNYVKKILADAGGKHSSPGQPAQQGASYRTTTTTTPGVDNSAGRQQAKLAYLQSSHDPDALLNLGLSLRGLQDTPSTTSTKRVRTNGVQSSGGTGASQTGSALVDQVKQEADRIDQAHVGYLWGGGHAGKQIRGSKVTPLDCSGAVSRVLGVNPRVSGEFEKWGKPGRGKVTVYANGHHVLMEINGHFWGTSASNPGGGPGWIPRGKIPPGYLKSFKARHA